MKIRMLTIEEMTEQQRMHYEMAVDYYKLGVFNLAKLFDLLSNYGIIIEE